MVKNKNFYCRCYEFPFGGIPIDMYDSDIDYLVSSSNKCLHGPPGLSFCIANKEKINRKIIIFRKTLSLDLKKTMGIF